MPNPQSPAQRGFALLYLTILIAVALAAFFAGRYSADGSLAQENKKLRESVRLLRGDKLGIGVAPSDAPAQPALSNPPPAPPPVAETPPPEASAPPPGPLEAPAPMAEIPPAEPETPTPPPRPKKTSKSWVSDLGEGVQGTATYWHCNNAKLVSEGMEYYAYGSVPANRLKQAGDAYSVKDGKAIVISGCWSPRLDKAILYRKRDGHRWEPTFKLDDGSWTLDAN